MQRLIKKIEVEKNNIFSIVSTTAVGSIVSFIMVLAFANLVEAHVLGTYQYVISIISVIGAFSLGGILSSIIRALGSKDYAFLAIARKYIYVGSIPAIIAGVVIGAYYYIADNTALGVSIIVGNILYIHMLTQYRFNSIYTALGDIYTANLLIKIYSIAPLLCVFPALFFIKEGHALAVIYFAAIWLAFILGSRYLGMKAKEEDLIGQCQSNFRNTPEHTKLIWFGFHQSVNSLLNTASAHLDKIIIFQLLGAQQTAIYFIAISMPNRFRGILKQFDGYIFARFAKHSLEAVQNKLLKRFLIAMLLVIPIYIVYMVTAPWFFNILLPEYTEAAHLSQIYAITLFAGAVIIPQSVLKAHSNSRIFYLLTICFSIIRISFVFIGVTIYGTTGAIYGVTIAALLYLIANLLAASTFKINPAKNLDF